MSTINTIEGGLTIRGARFGIIASRFNSFIVDSLVDGTIDLKTPVAREGGDFFPIAKVAAFEDALPQIKKANKKRNAKKVMRLLDALEEHDDAQNVSSNVDIPDEIVSQLDA